MNSTLIAMIEWPSLIWPLAFLLVALILLRQLRNDLSPIFRVVITGVAKNAQSNAIPYAIAIITATLASLQELSNVAHEMGWPYVSAVCRILQPGLATLIAYAMKPPASVSGVPDNKPASPSVTSTPQA